MNEAVIAVISVVLGGGIITAIVAAYKARAERRKTDAEADAVGAKTPAEVESISMTTMTNALNGARSINDDYRKDNQTLRDQLSALAAEVKQMREQQEADRDTTHREFESLRRGLAVAHQYISTLLAWIEEHLPGVQPPGPPSGYRPDNTT